MEECLKKKYNDFGKMFIENYYLIEDRNYTAEEYERVWWDYNFFFSKDQFKGHLNNCHKGITSIFKTLIDDSLKSDDPNFIQNKINENTKRYRLLMQERIKERVEELIKENEDLDTSS